MPCVAAPRSEPPLRRSSCSSPRRRPGRSTRPRHRPRPAARRRSRPRTCTRSRPRIASRSVPRSTATWPMRPTVERMVRCRIWQIRLTKAAAGSTATPGRAPSTALAFGPPVQATPTTDPPIGHPGFDGLSKSSGPDTNGEPPDPWLAVGPEHVMQVVNSSFRITDRQGVQQRGLRRRSPASWTCSGSPSSAMPCGSIRTSIYDSLHGRWLLTMDGFDCNSGVDSSFGHGYLFFATSDTIDPTGSWTGSYLLGTDLLIDYTRARNVDRQVRVREQPLQHDRRRIVPLAVVRRRRRHGHRLGRLARLEPRLQHRWHQHGSVQLRPARRRAIPGHKQPPPRRHGSWRRSTRMRLTSNT